MDFGKFKLKSYILYIQDSDIRYSEKQRKSEREEKRKRRRNLNIFLNFSHFVTDKIEIHSNKSLLISSIKCLEVRLSGIERKETRRKQKILQKIEHAVIVGWKTTWGNDIYL